MNILDRLRKIVATPILEAIITDILDEAVLKNKITEEQKNLIIELGAELGKIKLKK